MIIQFDLSDFDEASIANLKYLSKQKFNPKMIVYHATNLKQKNDIRSILEANYKQPSEEFVRFFAAEMYSAVIPLGFVDELAPLVRQVFRDFVEGENKSFPVKDVLGKVSREEVVLSQPTTLHDFGNEPTAREYVLIPVYAHYEGEDITAQFKVKRGYKQRGDKVILYEGVWGSVSGWAKELKNRIHRKLNMNIKKSSETAGWTNFWYYKDAKGKEGILDDFRKNPKLVERYLRDRQQ